MALGLTVNLPPAGTGKGKTPRDLAYPTRHFGATEGRDAFLSLSPGPGFRASFATPAVLAEACPDGMARLLDLCHEVTAQRLLGEDPATLPAGQETAQTARAAPSRQG